MTAIFGGIITIIGLLVKTWLDNMPQRTKEKEDAITQTGRTAIATGNDVAVSERLDGVLSDNPASSATGQHDTSDILNRVSTETGAEILPDRP